MLDTPQVSRHAGVVPIAGAPAAVSAATRALVPLFAATLFLSSFLMFTVEPMVARQMHEVGWAKKDHSADVEKYVDLRFLAKATGLSEKELSGF